MRFSELATQLRGGTLTEKDLEKANVCPDDFFKLRQDEDPSQQFADDQSNTGPPSIGERRYRYVFVTESPIGMFKDVPLAKGWNMDAFRDRKSPILLQHGYGEGGDIPVGNAPIVRKNQKYNDLLALMGHVQYAPKGLSETADFVEGMVAAGMLNGGSVGFQITKMRRPTDDEKMKWGLGKYSTIFEKMSLSEYSVLGVGRDPHSGVIYADGGDEKFENYVLAGEWSDDTVLEMRERLFARATGKTTVSYESVDEWLSDMDGPKEETTSYDEDEVNSLRTTVRELSARVETLEEANVTDEEAPAAKFSKTSFLKGLHKQLTQPSA